MRNLRQQAEQPQRDDTTDFTYIYGLIDPTTDMVRYIGKSHNPKQRLTKHLSPRFLNETTHKANWLRKLAADGFKPILAIIEEVDRCHWQEAERKWIAHYRELLGEGVLTNTTSGGDGAEKGSKHKPETLKKMSIARKGRIFTEETRARMRMSRSNMGKKRSPETKQSVSEGKRRAWNILSSEQRKEYVATYMKPIEWTNELRERVAIAHRKRPKKANCTSQFIGVYWAKREQLWRSSVRFNGKMMGTGYFKDEIEAAKARDRKAIEIYGDATALNFARSDYE